MKKSVLKVANLFLNGLARLLPTQFQVISKPVIPAAKEYLLLPVNINDISNPLHDKFNSDSVELDEVCIYTIYHVEVSSDGIIYKNLSVFNPSLPGLWVKPLIERA